MDFQARVAEFYRHYHDAVKTRPDLYRNNDHTITVVLPKDLLDYANASAGHSGFGSGARAVGIRRTVADSTKELARIFESPETLARFIESSECDGPAYVEAVRQRHLSQSQPKPVLARDSLGFWSKYSKEDMAEIKRQNKDHQQLLQDYNTLTLAEFELKYCLAA